MRIDKGLYTPIMTAMPPRQEMERAFLQSDATYNGVFYTAVRTTGIFCRPVCPARKPKPENVEFFPSVKAAMFAGYRPCKRCRPTEAGAPEWVQSLMEWVESTGDVRIREAQLRERGLEPSRVRRYFIQNYGMTFQAYCRARRLGQALQELRGGQSIDNTVFDSGFDSHSGFREAFSKWFGAPPGEVRKTGADCLYLAWIESPLGALLAGAVDEGICLLEFTDRRMLEAQLTRVGRLFRKPIAPGENAHLIQLRRELNEYFSGTRREFDVPLVFPGSSFENQVWAALREIPYGVTLSYEKLANIVGRPKAARAAGSANGRNRLAILIPCHRVVNKDGELGGYGGGLWRKKFLLDLERQCTSTR